MFSSFPSWPKEVSELTVYQRTPIWVMPKFDVVFPPAVQRLFAKPAAYPALPAAIHRSFHGIHGGDRDVEVPLVQAGEHGHIRPLKNLSVAVGAGQGTSRKLDPDYDFGCKRPTLSNTYYRAFNQRYVHLEAGGIERIEPDGIVARDGTKRFIDTLVLATGFDVWDANLPAIEVIGGEGRDLGKWWPKRGFKPTRASRYIVPELCDPGQPVRMGGVAMV